MSDDDGTDDQGGTNQDNGDETDIDNVDTVDAPADISSSCAVGKVVIEATVNGDEDRVRSHAPVDLIDDEEEWGIYDFKDEWTVVVDEIEAITCENQTEGDLSDEETATVNGEVGSMEILDYHFEYVHDGEPYQQSVEVFALEVDDEWHAWIPYGFLVEREASVETNTLSDIIEYTLTDLGKADGVFVLGEAIEDPSEALLTTEGESMELPLEQGDDSRVEFITYAYIGDDPSKPDAQTMIHEFGSGSRTE